MVLERSVLAALVGPCDVEELEESPRDLGLGACPHCASQGWQMHALEPSAPSGIASCRSCGAIWLAAGELGNLRRRWAARRPLPAVRSQQEASKDVPLDLVPVSRPSKSTGSSTFTAVSESSASWEGAAPLLPATLEPEPARPRDWVPSAPSAVDFARTQRDVTRFSFDRGVGNLIGVPLLLLLSLLFCSGDLGRFLAALVGMPFHELGHAAASWLSSRVAVPLPFFTVWLHEQSTLFGLFVASLLIWFGVHSWRERSHFGVGLAGTLLLLQLTISWLIPARHTLMLQILSGVLGEILLSGLLLVAFHFPLPDRLRWDFWRWPALIPAALCFVQALLLWSRALDDPSQMPWGSAVGSASDGDMNRLVARFGWTARGLAKFYLISAWAMLLAIAGSYAIAVRRYRRARRETAALPGDVLRG